jgi:hypothetical protein
MAELSLAQPREQLLDSGQVTAARCIEVSVCDAVHFRLLSPFPIFEMIGMRLNQRHPGKFEGFTASRGEVERTMRGSSLPDKIAACCTRNPDWLDDRQVLYGTELEVWMDLSYPNPWCLDLYHSILMAGKAFTIPRLGPFTNNFHALLMEKNGYELISEPMPPEQTVQILVGEHPYAKDGQLVLETPRRGYRVHPFASEPDLGSLLANGILEKALEEDSANGMKELAYQPRSLGYRIFGPSLVLLLQSLFDHAGPVAFTGPGAEYLTGLARSVQAFWPMMPEIRDPGKGAKPFSLFSMEEVEQSLFPDPDLPDGQTILQFYDLQPGELVLPVLKLFLAGFLEGPAAGRIRESASRFVRDYACMTRGLRINLPAAPVARCWRETILSPEEDFLAWVSVGHPLPGFRPSGFPWELRRMVTAGPWPSASYELARPFWRWWVKRSAREQVRSIREARESC